MKNSNIIYLILTFAILTFSCKKEDKNTQKSAPTGPDLTSPVGFYFGTSTISGQATESFALLLRPDFTGKDYRGVASTKDTTYLSSREMKWTYSGTNLVIETPLLNGYNYKATVKAPITSIIGISGYYSFVTFMNNGTFNVTRK
jgi:hypothetical protein